MIVVGKYPNLPQFQGLSRGLGQDETEPTVPVDVSLDIRLPSPLVSEEDVAAVFVGCQNAETLLQRAKCQTNVGQQRLAVPAAQLPRFLAYLEAQKRRLNSIARDPDLKMSTYSNFLAGTRLLGTWQALTQSFIDTHARLQQLYKQLQAGLDWYVTKQQEADAVWEANSQDPVVVANYKAWLTQVAPTYKQLWTVSVLLAEQTIGFTKVVAVASRLADADVATTFARVRELQRSVDNILQGWQSTIDAYNADQGIFRRAWRGLFGKTDFTGYLFTVATGLAVIVGALLIIPPAARWAAAKVSRQDRDDFDFDDG